MWADNKLLTHNSTAAAQCTVCNTQYTATQHNTQPSTTQQFCNCAKQETVNHIFQTWQRQIKIQIDSRHNQLEPKSKSKSKSKSIVIIYYTMLSCVMALASHSHLSCFSNASNAYNLSNAWVDVLIKSSEF